MTGNRRANQLVAAVLAMEAHEYKIFPTIREALLLSSASRATVVAFRIACAQIVWYIHCVTNGDTLLERVAPPW
jgi:hypothetical protein